jgi:selenocysteine lyase/cysteine desulfurase
MTIDLSTSAADGVATEIDVAAERERTVGTRNRHYFNAAGAGLPSDAVVDAVVHHLRTEQHVGGYEAANRVAPAIEAVYADAATLLGGQPDEIALFDSATTGLRVVFDALRLGRGDTVIAPRSSYVSQALRLLSLRDYDGVELVILPNGADGALDLDALDAALLAAGPGAVLSAVHVPTSSGLVEPIEEIGRIARAHEARYILDATQSVGQVDIDVEQVGCDVLITTGRKFLRGPRGTGLAFLRRSFLDRLDPWAPDVRGTEWTGFDEWRMSSPARKLETWESSVAGRVGLGVALREALERGLPGTERHLVELGADLRGRLAGIRGVEVADPPRSPSSIVTFTVAGYAPRDVALALRERRIDSIAIPAGHAQWDLGDRGLPGVVRVSPHVYNDETDAAALLEAIDDLARRVR